jgi:hypothetical protein
VRRFDASAGQDLTVQRAVCGRLDPAWQVLRRSGVTLSTFRRAEPGTEPVPNVGAARWAEECQSAVARPEWQAETETVRREMRHDG